MFSGRHLMIAVDGINLMMVKFLNVKWMTMRYELSNVCRTNGLMQVVSNMITKHPQMLRRCGNISLAFCDVAFESYSESQRLLLLGGTSARRSFIFPQPPLMFTNRRRLKQSFNSVYLTRQEMKNQCFGGEYMGEVFDHMLKR